MDSETVVRGLTRTREGDQRDPLERLLEDTARIAEALDAIVAALVAIACAANPGLGAKLEDRE